MNVHIVTNANRSLYADELEQMHRLRHAVFVEQLNWSALDTADKCEIDEFDDNQAVYLIASSQGRVHGSLRLLPTWRRCMIMERFPEWLATGETLPIGPDVWEWTRWCPGTTKSPRNLLRARSALIVGALEFALSRNIRTYMTFCELKFVGQIEELGWLPRPLCMPREFDQGVATAVAWDVRPELLAETRNLLRVSSPIAIEAPCVPEPQEGWAGPCELEALWQRRAAIPSAGDDRQLFAVQGNA